MRRYGLSWRGEYAEWERCREGGFGEFSVQPSDDGEFVRHDDAAALRQRLADALRRTRALQRQVDHALDIRADEVAALVEAAYFDGWQSGWLRAETITEACEAAKEYARAALARKEETPDAPQA